MRTSDALSRLRSMRRAVEKPGKLFWTPGRQAAWHEEARAAAREVLGLARPRTVAPEVWSAATDAVVERVNVLHRGDTLSIGISSGALVSSNGQDIFYGGASNEFTLPAILDWIEAGRRGDPMGKLIKGEQDNPSIAADLHGKSEERANLVIAWKIIRAMREGDHPNLRKSIEEFHAAHGTGGDSGEVIDVSTRLAILQDWKARFATRGAQEWREFWRTALRGR